MCGRWLGLSPLARGNRSVATAAGVTGGLSPLARGNPEDRTRLLCDWGPIPACAGQPPRLGSWIYSGLGLSPLARGNPIEHGRIGQGLGPIPACAGQPKASAAPGGGIRAYPRLRGATPITSTAAGAYQGLSPLARGNLPAELLSDFLAGPIPACAGQPSCGRCGLLAIWAYPRLRGATSRRALLPPLRRGLSPLARGNPIRPLP